MVLFINFSKGNLLNGYNLVKNENSFELDYLKNDIVTLVPNYVSTF